MSLQKIQNYLLFIFLFLLPWQARYIWHYGKLNGGYWEYGTFSVYAMEILLWIILILFFAQHFLRKEFWMKLKEKKNKSSFALILFLVFLAVSTALNNNFWISYNYIFKLLEAMALAVVLSGVISPLPRGSEEGVAEVLVAIDGPAASGIRDSRSRDKSPLSLLEKEGMTEIPHPTRGIRNDKYALALWAGAVAQGALAIWQFLTQQVWSSKWLGMAGQEAGNLGPSVIEFADQRWLRAYGSFGSPNSLGVYLAVLFALGLVLYLKIESAYHRHEARSRCGSKIFISAGQIIILSGLLLSFSRGAWLAAVVGALCLFGILIYNRKLSFPPQAGIRTIRPDTGFTLAAGMTALKDFAKQTIFALAVIIFWLVIFYPVFTARFNFNNRLEVKSISERKWQYVEALSFIKSNPVLGIGSGAYTYALYKKYPTLQSWQYHPIHNIYLMMIVELGIPLAFILLSFIIYLFVKIYKNNLVYLPIIATLLAAGFFDHWLWSMYGGILLWWVIFGLGLGDANNS
jgi:hypothetical protein